MSHEPHAIWPIMASSTEPEVHKLLRYCQRRTEPGNITENSVKFDIIIYVVFEIWEQTDIQTRTSQYFAPIPVGGGVKTKVNFSKR